MDTTIKFKRWLFAKFSGVGIALTKEEIKVNQVINDVKTNVAALVLDDIITKTNIQGYSSPGTMASSMIYVCHTKESKEVVRSLYSDTKVQTDADLSSASLDTVVPLVIAATASRKPMSEAIETVRDIIKDANYWEDDDKRAKVTGAIATFCDEFYRFMENKKVDGEKCSVLFENDINANGLDNSVKDGLLSPLPFLALGSAPLPGAAAEAEQVEDIEKDFKVNFEWSEEQKANIPDGSLKSFVMTPEAKKIARKIKHRLDLVKERMDKGEKDVIKNDYINLLLVGTPGTGKTKSIEAIAEMTGMPKYVVPMSKNTEEDVFEGKNKVVDGKISFVETDFIKAYENGGIIAIEEINLADPAVTMGSLGQAIEPPFVIMKDGYKPIKRHPMCVIIGTMNTGTNGSKAINEALSSRFRQTYIMDEPSTNVFIDILRTRGVTQRTAKWVYNAYTKIRKYLGSMDVNREDLCSNLSMRSCFGAIENMQEGNDPKDAIIDSIVGKIAERDVEIANMVKVNVVESLPELPAGKKL